MKKIHFLALLIFPVSCSIRQAKEQPLDLAVYNAEIEIWHQKRIEELKGPKGWLNLAGLFWLADGPNTFGSDSSNDVVFPREKIPARGGIITVRHDVVTIDPAPGVTITSAGKPVSHAIIFHQDSATTPLLEYGKLQWFIIKRDTKFGVRLRDFASDALQKFERIDRYPVDVAWRIVAAFRKSEPNKTVDITNVLGQTSPEPLLGTLVFSINGKEHSLDAFEGDDGGYFIIFGDATNARITYGAGRYLAVQKEDETGKTIIDFNKAYNPPCAFTAFATCPLPPKQDVLNIEITAGEKNYGNHH